MPRTQPSTSYLNIRNYAEKFSWVDSKTNTRLQGFNPPKDAIDVQRVPFHILAVSESGHRIEGMVTCIMTDIRKAMRKIRFSEDSGDQKAGDIRGVFDKFIIEIDGTRFVTH